MSRITLSSSSGIGMSFHQCTFIASDFFSFKLIKSNLAPICYNWWEIQSQQCFWGFPLPLGLNRTQRAIPSRKSDGETLVLSPSCSLLMSSLRHSNTSGSIPRMSSLSMETWECSQAEEATALPPPSFHMAISQTAQTKTQTHLPSSGESTEYSRTGHSLLVQAPASLSSSPVWSLEDLTSKPTKSQPRGGDQ